MDNFARLRIGYDFFVVIFLAVDDLFLLHPPARLVVKVVAALSFKIWLSSALPFGFETETLAQSEAFRNRYIEVAEYRAALGAWIPLARFRAQCLGDWGTTGTALNLGD